MTDPAPTITAEQLADRIIGGIVSDLPVAELREKQLHRFQDLHDVRDANMYVIWARESLGLGEPPTSLDGNLDFSLDNAAIDLVDAWFDHFVVLALDTPMERA